MSVCRHKDSASYLKVAICQSDSVKLVCEKINESITTEVNMSLGLAERSALENEKRALQRELESVSNQLRAITSGVGVGYNDRTAPLQYRRQSLEARIQTVDERLRHG